MEPPESTLYQDNLAVLMHTSEELGISLVMEKLEGPSTALTFLCIEIDTCRT